MKAGQTPVLIRLFVDHPVAADTYYRLLRRFRGFAIVGEDHEFLIGIFDMQSDELAVSLALQQRRTPGMRPIVLTNSAAQFERQAVCSIWGIIDYSRVRYELPAAIATVAAGRIWAPGEMLKNMAPGRPIKGDLALTGRESQVLDLLACRLPNKEIGFQLHITERTTKFHVRNVLRKLNLSSRYQVCARVGANTRANQCRPEGSKFRKSA
jgi:DNA-binding NarL/FixJ family response regulator